MKISKQIFLSLLALCSLQMSGVFAASGDEELQALDRGLIVERLRKAYAPVSFKFDGAWQAMTTAGSETWTFSTADGWKCPGSSVDCKAFFPLSFRWFGSGKAWLTVGGPQKKRPYSLKGETRAANSRTATDPDEPVVEVPTEEPAAAIIPAQSFETKRNALEVWTWTFPFDADAKVGISLRDYLVEQIQTDSQTESLEWAARPSPAKGLYLERLLIEKDGQKILLSRK